MKFPDYVSDAQALTEEQQNKLFSGKFIVKSTGRDGIALVSCASRRFEIRGSLARNRAFHGDTVLIRPGALASDAADEAGDSFGTSGGFDADLAVDVTVDEEDNMFTEAGHVVKILEANHRTTFVCTLYSLQYASHPVMIPLDRTLPAVIVSGVPGGFSPTALYKVTLTRWPEDHHLPCARFDEIFDPKPDNSQWVDALLLENNVVEEVRAPAGFDRGSPFEYAEADGRLDLTATRVFTIDPEGCQDMDDAVSIRKIEAGSLYEIGIHIADVAAFVKADSELDRQAAARANSVYFAQRNRIAHMLPIDVATDLCSLLPDKDRLTVSYFFTVSLTDKCVRHDSFRVKRSIINSCRQLSYATADELLRFDTACSADDADIAQYLQWLRDCCHVMNRKRLADGALQFGDQNPQLNFKYGSDHKPVSCVAEQRTDSHVIIEECALAVNMLAARMLHEKFGTEAIPLRVQDPPTRQHQQTLAGLHCHTAGLACEIDASTSLSLHQSLLRAQEGLSGERRIAVDKLVAMKMEPARYELCSPQERKKHYSMNALYTQVTSPIRRYFDLAATRMLLDGVPMKPEDCVSCNKQSTVARRMQRQSQDSLLVAMLANHPANAQAIVMKLSALTFTLAIPKFGLWDIELQCAALLDPASAGVLKFDEHSSVLSGDSWELRPLDTVDVSLAGRAFHPHSSHGRFAVRVKPPGKQWASCTEHVEHPTCFREHTPFRCDLATPKAYLKSQKHLVWAHALWSCVTSPDALRFQVAPLSADKIKWGKHTAQLQLSNPLLNGASKYAVCLRHDGDDELPPWCAHGIIGGLNAGHEDRRKTVRCNSFATFGRCPRSSADCWFAHGDVELQPLVYTMRIRFPEDQVEIPDHVRKRSDFTIEFLQLDVPFCRMISVLKRYHQPHIVTRVIRPLPALVPKKFPQLKDLNTSQCAAVARATAADFSCIQGPPGTGKTFTAAAVVVQLLQDSAYTYGLEILACAPSNKACDQLARTLAKADVRVVRMYASSVENDPVFTAGLPGHRHTLYEPPPDMDAVALHKLIEGTKAFPDIRRLRDKFKYSTHWDDTDHSDYAEAYNKARLEVFGRSDVLVCTCITAAGQKKEAFRAVLVDEAAQATEAEMLMPALLAAHRLILLGDQQQLGPTVSVKHGTLRAALSRSMFERFAQDQESRSNIHMLQVQYRMHKAICAFPSKMFYHNRLVTHDSVVYRQPLASEFPWTNQHRPVMFVDVKDGKEERVGETDEAGDGTTNPHSYFNQKEADVVVDVARRLLRDCKLRADQIAIISPYQAQRVLLKKLLVKLQIPESCIGTVHAFQGSERTVVIVSFVRSNQHTVGFLRDPRMLNVAITRAQHGLICVGHCQTLKRSAEMAVMLREIPSPVAPDHVLSAKAHKPLAAIPAPAPTAASATLSKLAAASAPKIGTGKNAIASSANSESDSDAAEEPAEAVVARPVYPRTPKKSNTDKKKREKAQRKRQGDAARAAAAAAAEASITTVVVERSHMCVIQDCHRPADRRCANCWCLEHWYQKAAPIFFEQLCFARTRLMAQQFLENNPCLLDRPANQSLLDHLVYSSWVHACQGNETKMFEVLKRIPRSAQTMDLKLTIEGIVARFPMYFDDLLSFYESCVPAECALLVFGPLRVIEDSIPIQRQFEICQKLAEGAASDPDLCELANNVAVALIRRGRADNQLARAQMAYRLAFSLVGLVGAQFQQLFEQARYNLASLENRFTN
eukprot:TRINITY_DN2599_c0_g2_i1.p1 TRINITY_DN2599_c0_g2~~TRINITY_DN2599_c0_g2_i1.p1  ORF type:complete len:1728 (+),score=324.48 TRINITY_DN2599_c0_g2_i1:84-5267(+)